MKKITARIWRRFEEVVALTIKSILETSTMGDVQEKLTEPTKDGGYDGIFMIPYITGKGCSINEAYYKILFEAKLRKNTDKDLPLQDFSKAIIIAINMDSDALIVATNLRLSDGTKNHLREFSDKTGLKTYYLSPYYIDNWMAEHLEFSTHIEDKDIRCLLQNSSTFSTLTPPLELLAKEDIIESVALPSLIGVKRKNLLGYVLAALKNPKGIVIITGDAGVGKSFFCSHLLVELEKRNQCVYSIDLKNYQTPRVLFIKLLESMWHIPFETLTSLDQTSLQSTLQSIDEDVVPTDLKNTILSAFSRNLENYSQDTEMLNYYMIKYLLIVHEIRSKHAQIILFFSNVNNLSPQMVDFVLKFLNDFTKQGRAILELRTSEYIDENMGTDEWNHYLKQFHSMEQILYQNTIENFDDSEAYAYIDATLNIPDVDSELMDSILKVTGCNPLYIGSLVEYLNISELAKTLPREVLLRKLDHLIVDDKRQLISMLVDVFCKKESFYAHFFEVIRLFRIPVEENYIGILLPDYQTEYIDQLVDVKLICRINHKLEVVHPLQFECILRCNSLMDYAKRQLSQQILTTLDQVSLSTETRAMIQIRCHDVLNEYQNVVDIAYPLAIGLLENGQYALCYKYSKTAINAIKKIDPKYQIFIHLKILRLMVEICIYQEENSVTEIDTYMNKLNMAINKFIPSEGKKTDFILFKVQYYMTKNRYEHYRGQFSQAFETLSDALEFAESNKNQLGDKIIGNLQVEYSIALKEKEDLNQSLAYLEECLKVQPNNSELLFTFHTQMYEFYLLCAPCEALKHTEENRTLCERLSMATTMHNEVHWINAHFYMKNYDICFTHANTLFNKADQIGLKNEAGRLANIIGNLYFIQKDFTNANLFYKYGIALFQEEGYISNIWALFINISTLLTETKNKEAIKYIQMSINILSDSYGERIRKPYPLPGYYKKLQVAVVILFYNIRKLEGIVSQETCKKLLGAMETKLLSDNFREWLFPLNCQEILEIFRETNHYHSNYLLLGN